MIVRNPSRSVRFITRNISKPLRLLYKKIKSAAVLYCTFLIFLFRLQRLIRYPDSFFSDVVIGRSKAVIRNPVVVLTSMI